MKNISMDKIKTRKELIKYTENLKEIRNLKLTDSKAEANRSRDIKIIEKKIKNLKEKLEVENDKKRDIS